MHIDLGKPEPTYGVSGFDLAPVDVAAIVARKAETSRDLAQIGLDRAPIGQAARCRVEVRHISARLRQRLAILKWLPEEPASDDVWYMEEPVAIPLHATQEVVRTTAQACAEVMGRLFCEQDGIFTGQAVPVGADPDIAPRALREHVRRLAERCYVMLALSGHQVPIDWLHARLRLATTSANAARLRAGLQPLVCPSASVVGRWKREFEPSLRDRLGLGAQWRSYERGPLRHASERVFQ